MDPDKCQPAPDDPPRVEIQPDGPKLVIQDEDDDLTRRHLRPIEDAPCVSNGLGTSMATSDLMRPRQIGRYWLDTPIGRGGFADVFRGHSDETEEPVAIKRMRPEIMRDPSIRKQFLAAARKLQQPQLQHENIVSIRDIYEDKDHDICLLVLEYVDGEDLRRLLDRQRVLPLTEAARIAWQVCSALRHAHSCGVVHCDIKPENILVGRDGRVKLGDFDIAYLASPSAKTPSAGRAGTAYYMAPEQHRRARSTSIDYRADLYAMGVVLYEMLAGEVPMGIIQPLRKRNRSIPREIDTLIRSALQPSPEARPKSAEAMMGVLQRYGQEVTRSRFPLPNIRRRGKQDRMIPRQVMLQTSIPLTLPRECKARGCQPWCLAADRDDNIYVALGDSRTRRGCVMYSSDLRNGGELHHLRCRQPPIMGLPRALAIRPCQGGGRELLVLSDVNLRMTMGCGLAQTRYSMTRIDLPQEHAYKDWWTQDVESPEDPSLAVDEHGNVLVAWAGNYPQLGYLDRSANLYSLNRPARHMYRMQIRAVAITSLAGSHEPGLLALTDEGVYATRLSPEYTVAEWQPAAPLLGGRSMVTDPQGYPYVSDRFRIHALHLPNEGECAWSHHVGPHSALAVGQRWVYMLVTREAQHTVRVHRLASYWALYTLLPMWGRPETRNTNNELVD